MPRIQRWFVLASFLLLNFCAPAQAPAPKQFAVLAGRLIDVRTGGVTNDAYILISGQRIVSVGPTAPSGVSVVDMSKFTLVPGLIDAHGQGKKSVRPAPRHAELAVSLSGAVAQFLVATNEHNKPS